ncbi:hypothetical protein OBK01_02565 [Empedobacter falsenii]
MKKLAAIINAYKRFWIQLPEEAKEQALQNNGYIDHRFIGNEYGRLTNLLKMESKESYDVKFGEPTFIYRPIILQGIENNNGWIKIESEEDLPKEDCIYWVVKDNSITEMENWEITLNFHNKRNLTHYQPIEQPKPPIY